MTKQEYSEIQEALNEQLKYKHGYHGNKGEIYKEAILAAKSILSSRYCKSSGKQ